MLGPGIPALAYLGGIQLDGLAHVLRERRIALHELGVEPVVQPQHVGEHQHLAVAGWPCADADGGDREGLGDLGCERRRDELQYDGKGARLLQRLGIGLESLGGFLEIGRASCRERV